MWIWILAFCLIGSLLLVTRPAMGLAPQAPDATIQIGNDTNIFTNGADGSESNIVVNIEDVFTNLDDEDFEVQISQFNFKAQNANVPITPFVVKVESDGDVNNYHDFKVVAIGTTRITYTTGTKSFAFNDGGAPTITLGPGDHLLAGFIDADASGNNDRNGTTLLGSTVPREEGGDKIWYTFYSYAANGDNPPNGFWIQLNQKPQPVTYGGNPSFQYMNRNYAFNIKLTSSTDPVVPTPTPSPIPTEVPGYQLENFDFEDEGDSLGDNKSSIAGWEVIGSNGVDLNSDNGNRSLDINTSTISQTVSGLNPGTPYVLRIDYMGNDNTNGTTADASVLIDGQVKKMGSSAYLPSGAIAGIHSNEARDFIQCNGFEFTTDTGTVNIQISSDEIGNTPNGLEIDNVRILEGTMPTAPEHNFGDLVEEEGGWRQLANGGFQDEFVGFAESIENTGPDSNPHLCGAGLSGWLVSRESIDLIQGSGFAIPEGSPPTGNWIIDIGGQGPGGIAQTITGLDPNAEYVLKFYAARHTAYGTDDMTSELWANGSFAKEIVRTSAQTGDNGYILELVALTSDADGKLAIELFSTTPDQSGNIVYDNFSLVSAANFPTFTSPGNQFNNVGDSVFLELVVNDENDDTLTFTAINLPPDLEISPVTGTISGTVDTAGVYTPTITVDDGNTAPIAKSFTWTVNTVPTIDSISDQADTTEDSVEIDVTADDDDGDALVYSAEGLPSGAVIISDTGKITGTLLTSGLYSVTVTVDDLKGGTASTQFEWDVNDRPILTNIGDQKTNLGESVDVTVPFVDSDEDVWIITATGLPDGLGIDTSTGQITGSPTTAGTSAVTISIEDQEGGTDTFDISWLINTIPVINSTHDDMLTNIGDPVALKVLASDLDGDELTYSAEDLPAGVTINPATGDISGTNTQGGNHTVVLKVTDGNGGEATVSFNWKINSPPFVNSPGTVTVNLNAAVDFTIDGGDDDGDAVTFIATGLPTGLTIDPSTGQVTGSATVAGSYGITIIVEDPNSQTASVSFTLVVNTPPVATDPGAQTASTSASVNVAIAATDADGDSLTFSATGLPEGLSIDSTTGVISGTPTFGGKYTTTVTVSDGNGGEATVEISWDIEGPLPPTAFSTTIFLPMIRR